MKANIPHLMTIIIMVRTCYIHNNFVKLFINTNLAITTIASVIQKMQLDLISFQLTIKYFNLYIDHTNFV